MLQELRQISFHDSGLLRLDVDFLSKRIALTIEGDANSTVTIVFEGVLNLSCEALSAFSHFETLEIYDANFREADGAFEAKFTFLLGFGQPSWGLAFSFAAWRTTLPAGAPT